MPDGRATPMQTVTPSDTAAAIQAALVQWQFGDWHSLANTKRTKLTLIVAGSGYRLVIKLRKS